MTVDRELTDKVTPGNRVIVVGILTIVDKGNSSNASANSRVKETVKVSYIRVLGLQSVANQEGHGASLGFAMPTIS